MTPNPKPKPEAEFRVIFRDGEISIVTATNSLEAQRKAISKRPGMIREIQFLGNSQNG